MSVGMPAYLFLEEFGAHVWAAFEHPPYHVGSSLTRKTGWRDVDVRLILSDEDYAAQGFGNPKYPQQNEKWVALCMAFSIFGKHITGLDIDFQIQQQTFANEKFKGQRRSAIGFVPHKIPKD